MRYIPLLDMPTLIEDSKQVDNSYFNSSFHTGVDELVVILSEWRKEFPFVDIYLSGNLERTNYERSMNGYGHHSLFGLRRVHQEMSFEHTKIMAVSITTDMILLGANTLPNYLQGWKRKDDGMEWMHCASRRLREKGETNDCIWLSAGDTISFVGIRSDAKVDMSKVREFIRRHQPNAPLFLHTI